MPGNAPSFSTCSEVDAQLRRLSALIVRDFVQKMWYSSISADAEFPAEIMLALSRVFAELDRRARKLDTTQLVLIDLPYIIEQHFSAFRHAKAAVGTLLGGNRSLDELYHHMVPHIALDAPHYLDEYLREMLSMLLKCLLPTEDFDIISLRLLAKEILSGVILRSLITTLSDPDFLNSLIIKLLEKDVVIHIHKEIQQQQQLEKVTASKTYMDTLQRCKNVWFTKIKQKWRKLVKSVSLWIDVTRRVISQTRKANQTRTSYSRVNEPILSLVNELFQVHRRNKSAFFVRFYEFMCRPLLRFFAGAAIDQYLVALVDRFTSSRYVSQSIELLISALWPNGSFLKMAPKLTPQQSQQLRLQAETALLDAIPGYCKFIFTPAHLRDVIHEHTLEFFQGTDRNCHLLLNSLDIILARLFPELTVTSRNDPADSSMWLRNDQSRKHHHTRVTSTTVTAINANVAVSSSLSASSMSPTTATVSSTSPSFALGTTASKASFEPVVVSHSPVPLLSKLTHRKSTSYSGRFSATSKDGVVIATGISESNNDHRLQLSDPTHRLRKSLTQRQGFSASPLGGDRLPSSEHATEVNITTNIIPVDKILSVPPSPYNHLINSLSSLQIPALNKKKHQQQPPPSTTDNETTAILSII